MPNRISNSSSLWIILASALIAGCTASGPAFKPVDPIPAGEGVVYIYREPGFVGSGVYGTVTANKTPITKNQDRWLFPIHFKAWDCAFRG